MWFDWKVVLEEKILFDFLFTTEVFVKTSLLFILFYFILLLFSLENTYFVVVQLCLCGSVVCVAFRSFLRLSSTWLVHLLRQLHNECPLLPLAGDASQSESLSPEVAGRAKLLRFDLAMDLCLLRQSRLHPNHSHAVLRT